MIFVRGRAYAFPLSRDRCSDDCASICCRRRRRWGGPPRHRVVRQLRDLDHAQHHVFETRESSTRLESARLTRRDGGGNALVHFPELPTLTGTSKIRLIFLTCKIASKFNHGVVRPA